MKFLWCFFFGISAGITSFGQQVQDTTFIHFPFDQWVLTLAARQQADAFIAAFKNDSTGKAVQVKGFCDAIGTNAYNDRLSERRAHTVQQYLVQNGVPVSAIVLHKGYGERQPISGNTTAAERQLNRRVEIIWTKGESTASIPQPTKPVQKVPADSIAEFSEKAISAVQQGQTLRLRNINFYGGRHTFLPQSLPALTELLQVMKANPALEIEIQGHICCRYGMEEDGFDYDAGDNRLSHNRARAVYNYLAEQGIDKRRMTYKGFSGNYPLVLPEVTEEDRTANRRVEIKIIRK